MDGPGDEMKELAIKSPLEAAPKYVKRNTLKLYYNMEGIDKEPDKAIELVVKAFGYEWYGQGFNFDTGTRDLSFEKVVE